MSRYIRELEADLGFAIFKRTYRGMVPTQEGENFLQHVRSVLSQIDDIEKLYKGKNAHKQRFSISVPRASYIADAFVQFSRSIDTVPTEICYTETNTGKTIQNLLEADYRLGIIRYAAEDEKYFRGMLDEKGIESKLLTDFTYMLLLGRNSPLADKEEIFFSDLEGLIEITSDDSPVSPMSSGSVINEQPKESERSVLLSESGCQYDLLCENEQTYMWTSPVPEKLLKRYGLVQRSCQDRKRVYRDVLIRRKGYELTEMDRHFISELVATKRMTLQ